MEFSTLNGYKVKDKKAVRYYETVELMKNDSTLKHNMYVKTKGYYTANDGGMCEYHITNTQSNSHYQENLQNGLYATLLINDKKLNIKQLGLSDKEDYTNDFNNLDSIINKLGIEELIFNEEVYNVTEPITFDIENKKIIFNFNGATIKLNDNIRYFMEGIFTINMNKDIQSECYLYNGKFDGSGTAPSFLETDTSPNGGRGMFFINGARYIKADNLYFSDWFYSACIWSHYCSNADITNITGVRVGGRSATNDEDARGDAIYFGYSGVVYDENDEVDEDNSQNVNIRVENCNFSSWEAIENESQDSNIRNGSQSGRCGIVFGEYSQTKAVKNLYVNNSYFYNYQRGIHLEGVDNVNMYINNTTFDNYGEVLLLSDNITANNIKFNNCTFKKDVDVIAIYNGYNYIITGHTINDVKNITFDNCLFNDEYNGLVTYGKGINLKINNSILNFSNLEIITDTKVKFNNSIVNYNIFTLYNSIFNFNNCTINGGYLNNEVSRNFIKWTGASYYTNENNIIKNCMCNNVGIVGNSNKMIMSNSEFTFNENFKNIDGATTRNYFFNFYDNRLERITNCIFNNSNTTITNIFDSAGTSNTAYVINDNIFRNVKLTLFSGTDFKCKIYNNQLYNTNTSITSGADFYNNKAVIYNNIFIGYSSVSNYKVGIQFNNYLSTDGSSMTLLT